MAKKKLRSKYTSKGGNGGRFLSGKVTRDIITVTLDKWNAFLRGKKVYITLEDPDPKNTRERYKRVEMSTVYGDYRKY